jgi:hypothetical protein
MFYSFAGQEGPVCPETVLHYFPGGFAEELHVLHDAHLFILQFHTNNSGLAGREKWPTFFSVAWPRVIFYGLGVQDVAEFDFLDFTSLNVVRPETHEIFCQHTSIPVLQYLGEMKSGISVVYKMSIP